MSTVEELKAKSSQVCILQPSRMEKKQEHGHKLQFDQVRVLGMQCLRWETAKY